MHCPKFTLRALCADSVLGHPSMALRQSLPLTGNAARTRVVRLPRQAPDRSIALHSLGPWTQCTRWAWRLAAAPSDAGGRSLLHEYCQADLEHIFQYRLEALRQGVVPLFVLALLAERLVVVVLLGKGAALFANGIYVELAALRRQSGRHGNAGRQSPAVFFKATAFLAMPPHRCRAAGGRRRRRWRRTYKLTYWL
jgi:hypothetical protein